MHQNPTPHPEVPTSYQPQPYFPGPMPYAGWAYPVPQQQPPVVPPPPPQRTPVSVPLSTVATIAASALFLGGSVTASYVWSLPQNQMNRQVHQQAEQFSRVQEIACPNGGYSNAF